jgi:hypothetical protein
MGRNDTSDVELGIHNDFEVEQLRIQAGALYGRLARAANKVGRRRDMRSHELTGSNSMGGLQRSRAIKTIRWRRLKRRRRARTIMRENVGIT